MVKNSDFSRYLVVGVFNTLMDIGIFILLSNVYDIYPVVSNIVSTVIVLSISFFLNYYFVFKSDKSKWKTAPFFVGTTLFNGWVVQSLVIWIIISIPLGFLNDGMVNMLAKVCGVGVGMVFNFIGYKTIFKGKIV